MLGIVPKVIAHHPKNREAASVYQQLIKRITGQDIECIENSNCPIGQVFVMEDLREWWPITNSK
jgi:hypothetical protein